jgi:hypothetical protein
VYKWRDIDEELPMKITGWNVKRKQKIFKNMCKIKLQIGKKKQNIDVENIFRDRTLPLGYRVFNFV